MLPTDLIGYIAEFVEPQEELHVYLLAEKCEFYKRVKECAQCYLKNYGFNLTQSHAYQTWLSGKVSDDKIAYFQGVIYWESHPELLLLHIDCQDDIHACCLIFVSMYCYYDHDNYPDVIEYMLARYDFSYEFINDLATIATGSALEELVVHKHFDVTYKNHHVLRHVDIDFCNVARNLMPLFKQKSYTSTDIHVLIGRILDMSWQCSYKEWYEDLIQALFMNIHIDDAKLYFKRVTRMFQHDVDGLYQRAFFMLLRKVPPKFALKVMYRYWNIMAYSDSWLSHAILSVINKNASRPIYIGVKAWRKIELWGTDVMRYSNFRQSKELLAYLNA